MFKLIATSLIILLLHLLYHSQESVLQLKLEEAAHNDEQIRDESMVHYNIPKDLLASVSMSRRNLESNIMKFEHIITQLEEIWETKVSIDNN